MITLENKANVKTVKGSIFNVIEAKDGCEHAVFDSRRKIAGNLNKSTGEKGLLLIELLHDVIGAAIRGVARTGKDLEYTVKVFVIGTLKKLNLTGEEAYSAVRALSSSIVECTVNNGGDVVVATQGLLKGVIGSAKHAGIDVEKAISEAITGAVKSGYDINREVMDKVKLAATGTMG